MRAAIVTSLTIRRLVTGILACLLVPIAAFGPHLGVVRGAAVAPTTRGLTFPRDLGPAVSLPGSLLSVLRSAHALGPVPDRQPVTVAVALTVQHQEALTSLLTDLYNPSSPRYHHFLTTAQFRAQFAPPAAADAAVRRWLRQNQLRVSGLSGNGLEITATGTVGAATRAFGTPLVRYRSGHGVFRANAWPVRVPSSLAGVITGVGGLDTWTRQRPVSVQVHAPSAGASGGYTPAEVSRLYDLGPVAARANGGAGQTVGLVAFANFQDSVVSEYDRTYGVGTAPMRIVSSPGVTYDGSSETEIEMDIELVQSVAPRASIRVYEGSNDDAGAISVYNRIVSENVAQTISSSWGDYESAYPQDVLNAMHNALQEAAAQGQTFFAASGDNGAFDQASDTQNGDSTALAVDYPASDPFATGVGGTTLTASNDGSYGGEIAWSSIAQQAGSGGGLSSMWKRPAYQQGPGVLNADSNGMRQVPDVAAVGDPRTGVAIYAASDGGAARWHDVGGTSVSAPLWAGFVTLINGARGSPIGFLNPTLYALGSRSGTFGRAPFHDIVEGTNLKYTAGPGWDYTTGWGTMDGDAFLAALPATVPASVASSTPTATPLPTQVAEPTTTARVIFPTATPRVIFPTATPVKKVIIKKRRTPTPGPSHRKKPVKKP